MEAFAGLRPQSGGNLHKVLVNTEYSRKPEQMKQIEATEVTYCCVGSDVVEFRTLLRSTSSTDS